MEYEPGLSAVTVRLGGARAGPAGRGHKMAEIRIVHGTEDLHSTVINAVNVSGDSDDRNSNLGFWSVVLDDNLEEESIRDKVKLPITRMKCLLIVSVSFESVSWTNEGWVRHFILL